MVFIKLYFMSMMMVHITWGNAVQNCFSSTNFSYDVVKARINCECLLDSMCFLMVKCRLKNTSDLEDFDDRSLVYSLDLSRNGLEVLRDKSFKGFEAVSILKLSYNNLRYIQRGVFQGLSNLTILDLRFNQLHTWDAMDINKQLPSLTELDVTGNPRWMPTKHMRSLPSITTIKGVVSHTIRYTGDCVFCDLLRSKDLGKVYINVSSVQHECLKITFYLHGNLSRWEAKNFTIRCRTETFENEVCKYQRQTFIEPTRYSVSASDVCWSSIIKWTTFNIPLSLLAIAINAVVIVTISSSRVLKKNITLYLIGNIAFGDFCQGLYLFILTLTRRTMSSFQFYEFKNPYFCFFLIVLYFSAHFFSVLVCFLVAVERYLCVVFSTNPNVRITSRMAKLLLLIVWLLISVAIAIPYILQMNISSFNDYTCVYISVRRKQNFVGYLGTVGVLLYSLSFILYARVFYTVRKSNTNMGIQREGRLAKRIMFMISTNVFFFLTPVIVSYTEQSGFTNFLKNNIINLYVYLNTFVFMCFVLNSCLNPFLYAFWNDKFRTELLRMLGVRIPTVAGAFEVNDASKDRRNTKVAFVVSRTVYNDRNLPSVS